MADAVLPRYKQKIAGLTLVPSDGGKFELSLDGRLLFSKKKEGRFPEHAEIFKLIDGALARHA